MNWIKYSLHNVNVLNVLLLIAAVILFFNIHNSFPDREDVLSSSSPKAAMTEDAGEKVHENIPHYSDYAVIVEKNLFHPQRKIVSAAKEEQQVVRPEIILYGTLITDEKKVAYIGDNKNPYSTPGREKRQSAVNEGAMISGYKLTKINAESIELIRGDDKLMVTLNAHKEKKTGELSGVAASSPAEQIIHQGTKPPQTLMPALPIPARPSNK